MSCYSYKPNTIAVLPNTEPALCPPKIEPSKYNIIDERVIGATTVGRRIIDNKKEIMIDEPNITIQNDYVKRPMFLRGKIAPRLVKFDDPTSLEDYVKNTADSGKIGIPALLANLYLQNTSSRNDKVELGVQLSNILTNVEQIRGMDMRELRLMEGLVEKLRISKHWEDHFSSRFVDHEIYRKRMQSVLLFLFSNIPVGGRLSVEYPILGVSNYPVKLSTLMTVMSDRSKNFIINLELRKMIKYNQLTPEERAELEKAKTDMLTEPK